MNQINHFGLNLKSKKDFFLSRGNYAEISNKSSLPKFPIDIYEDDEGKFYKDPWCEKHYSNVMENFDLNIEFFKKLDQSRFNNEINDFLKKHNEFIQVEDLNDFDKKSGYYIMVLDSYKQLYIGTALDIKQRIKTHWQKNKSFDRLLFPMNAVDTSTLSIDSFKALDTTRIYAYQTKRMYDFEDKFINAFSPEFLCNRIAGGRMLSLLQIVSTIKRKDLK